jgi:hypothetical protein
MIFFFIIVSEKGRELGAAQGEIKALRATEALKDKAIEEVSKFCGYIAWKFYLYHAVFKAHTSVMKWPFILYCVRDCSLCHLDNVL